MLPGEACGPNKIALMSPFWGLGKLLGHSQHEVSSGTAQLVAAQCRNMKPLLRSVLRISQRACQLKAMMDVFFNH